MPIHIRTAQCRYTVRLETLLNPFRAPRDLTIATCDNAASLLQRHFTDFSLFFHRAGQYSRRNESDTLILAGAAGLPQTGAMETD